MCGAEASSLFVLGQHPGHGLSVKLHLRGKQRLVVADRADVVLAGHVARGQHTAHAGSLQRRSLVDLQHPRVRVGGHDRPGVDQLPHAGGEVVDVARATRHVARCRLVGKGAADLLSHGDSSAWLSCQNFSSKLPIIALR